MTPEEKQETLQEQLTNALRVQYPNKFKCTDWEVLDDKFPYKYTLADSGISDEFIRRLSFFYSNYSKIYFIFQKGEKNHILLENLKLATETKVFQRVQSGPRIDIFNDMSTDYTERITSLVFSFVSDEEDFVDQFTCFFDILKQFNRHLSYNLIGTEEDFNKVCLARPEMKIENPRRNYYFKEWNPKITFSINNSVTEYSRLPKTISELYFKYWNHQSNIEKYSQYKEAGFRMGLGFAGDIELKKEVIYEDYAKVILTGLDGVLYKDQDKKTIMKKLLYIYSGIEEGLALNCKYWSYFCKTFEMHTISKERHRREGMIYTSSYFSNAKQNACKGYTLDLVNILIDFFGCLPQGLSKKFLNPKTPLISVIDTDLKNATNPREFLFSLLNTENIFPSVQTVNSSKVANANLYEKVCRSEGLCRKTHGHLADETNMKKLKICPTLLMKFQEERKERNLTGEFSDASVYSFDTEDFDLFQFRNFRGNFTRMCHEYIPSGNFNVEKVSDIKRLTIKLI